MTPEERAKEEVVRINYSDKSRFKLALAAAWKVIADFNSELDEAEKRIRSRIKD